LKFINKNNNTGVHLLEWHLNINKFGDMIIIFYCPQKPALFEQGPTLTAECGFIAVLQHSATNLAKYPRMLGILIRNSVTYVVSLETITFYFSTNGRHELVKCSKGVSFVLGIGTTTYLYFAKVVTPCFCSIDKIYLSSSLLD